jgi:tetratricopeptide (TPR) repeat protein
MKIILLLIISAIIIGCSKAPVAVQQNSNTGPQPDRSERTQTVIAHSSENQPAPMPNNSGEPATSKWTQGGSAIDTSKFDEAIDAADKNVKAKPNDEAAKKTLSRAFFDRAVALTDARQYASALGDYRRAVKYDPTNQEAKDWIDQIVMIYGSMKRESPKEGEEPPPLPYKGGK